MTNIVMCQECCSKLVWSVQILQTIDYTVGWKCLGRVARFIILSVRFIPAGAGPFTQGNAIYTQGGFGFACPYSFMFSLLSYHVKFYYYEVAFHTENIIPLYLIHSFINNSKLINNTIFSFGFNYQYSDKLSHLSYLKLSMLEQYQTLVPQQSFQSFGLVTTIIGLFLLAYLFIYQTAYKSKERQLTLEVVIAFLSSGALATGIFLLALGVGIYM